jgi:hypothetical protein
MKLSDAVMRCGPTKLIYPNHRLPPWLTEDATRDRSNRLLDDITSDLAIEHLQRDPWRRRRPIATAHQS